MFVNLERNKSTPMEYKESFSEVLSIAEHIGEHYIGHGNPNGPILIIANEPGTINEYTLRIDLDKNLEIWKANYKNC